MYLFATYITSYFMYNNYVYYYCIGEIFFKWISSPKEEMKAKIPNTECKKRCTMVWYDIMIWYGYNQSVFVHNFLCYYEVGIVHRIS